MNQELDFKFYFLKNIFKKFSSFKYLILDYLMYMLEIMKCFIFVLGILNY